MTRNEAIKDLQDIWDAVVKYNEHIQDVDFSEVPALQHEFKEIVNSNEVIKMGPQIKAVLQSLKNLSVDALLVEQGDQRKCRNCGQGFFLHKECSYHDRFSNTPINCTEFIEE